MYLYIIKIGGPATRAVPASIDTHSRRQAPPPRTPGPHERTHNASRQGKAIRPPRPPHSAEYRRRSSGRFIRTSPHCGTYSIGSRRRFERNVPHPDPNIYICIVLHLVGFEPTIPPGTPRSPAAERGRMPHAQLHSIRPSPSSLPETTSGARRRSKDGSIRPGANRTQTTGITRIRPDQRGRPGRNEKHRSSEARPTPGTQLRNSPEQSPRPICIPRTQPVATRRTHGTDKRNGGAPKSAAAHNVERTTTANRRCSPDWDATR